MARRKQPDPAVTARWHNVLSRLHGRLTRQKLAVADTEREIQKNVYDAFHEGVLASPLKDATGLSSSRLHQLRVAERERRRRATGTSGPVLRPDGRTPAQS